MKPPLFKVGDAVAIALGLYVFTSILDYVFGF